ncbi:MAG: type VI secretion system protein TssA [Planctomycetaceae bacterium]
MSSEIELDIPALLAPFEGDSRGGQDLRESDDPNNSYRRIRDARNEAREEERQADISGESHAEADRHWRDVWNEGQEYLQNVAKDLEIVAYMIEASIRLGRFSGLAQSLRLTKELVDAFWGEVLPTPDEDGIETTVRPISRMNGDVITYPLARVPVTADTSIGELVVWQYVQAQQLESMGVEEREERVSRGAATLEMFNRAVAETPIEFYQQLVTDLADVRAATTELRDAFVEKVGEEDAPFFSKFEAAYADAENVVSKIAGDRLAAAEMDAADSSEAEGSAAAGEGGSGGSGSKSGGLGSREDAFAMLENAARWFEKHEPQSILPSEIRKAIRRGRMNPEELYRDLISDEAVRHQLYRDVGIEIQQEAEEYS